MDGWVHFTDTKEFCTIFKGSCWKWDGGKLVENTPDTEECLLQIVAWEEEKVTGLGECYLLGIYRVEVGHTRCPPIISVPVYSHHFKWAFLPCLGVGRRREGGDHECL